MEVKKISEKDNLTRLLVSGTSTAFVNSIRRATMNSVPVMAIENVLIYENSSVMIDEQLCHRLSLLPIKTDNKVYKKGEKVKMVLEKEGPCTVYSKDIQSTEPSIEVIDKKVPIVKLAKNQTLKLELEAVMGVGKEHAKWQPGLVAFNEVPDVSVKFADPKEQKAFLATVPEGVFHEKGGKLVLTDPVSTDIDVAAKAVETAPGPQKFETKEGSFVLSVENFGQLETSELLSEAANVLSEKAKQLKEELKKI